MLPAPKACRVRPGHRQWLRACRADSQQKRMWQMTVYTGDILGSPIFQGMGACLYTWYRERSAEVYNDSVQLEVCFHQPCG